MRTCVAFIVIGLTLVHGYVAPRNSISADKEVCYEKYGCFSNGWPWTSTARPLSALPKAPWEVGTRFLLFTRNDSPAERTGYELVPDADAILRFSNFDGGKRTIFFIHGFTDSHAASWVVNARTKLLAREDANVIVVDWAPGAKSPYLSATANTRLVGSQLSYMLRYLESRTTINVGDIRVIAHSLGAHVAGYAGDRLDGRIGTITALDPMDPYFGGTDSIVRLDPNDAQFVEVIHTNGETGLNFGLGVPSSLGHVDIFPNGGKTQPGCKDTLGNLVSSILKFITLDFEGAIGTWACSHVRVVDFYVESITSNCPFISHHCSSYNDFQKGNCYSDCSNGGCYLLGYGSEQARSKAATGTFFLNTNSNSDFCMNVAQPETKVSSSQSSTQGSVTVQFISASDGSRSDKYTIADGRMGADDTLKSWIELSSSYGLLGQKPRIVLHYKRGGLIPSLQPRYLALKDFNVKVLNAQLQLQTVEYGSVTLEAGFDIILS